MNLLKNNIGPDVRLWGYVTLCSFACILITSIARMGGSSVTENSRVGLLHNIKNDRTDKFPTIEEMEICREISVSILVEEVIPWEVANLEHLPIEKEFEGQIVAILIPPHPEELISKARRRFEKELHEKVGERITVTLPYALAEWQYTNSFTDKWTLVTKEDGEEYYVERFRDRDQLTTLPTGGFSLNRDVDNSRNVPYQFPSYSALKELEWGDRYFALF